MRAVAVIFAFAVGSLVLAFLNWAGWQFCAGVFSGIAFYQVSHKILHGHWIDL